MRWSREDELVDFPLETRNRLTTLALKRNLSHIRWREEHPYGVSNPASVGMQLAMTLVFWLATCPLEEAMAALDNDPLSPKLKKQWAEPDFQAEHPEGLRFNLPKWREALARNQVAPILAGDGWYVVGLRAWLNDAPEWEMSLNRERLELIVGTLSYALIFWEMPITPPPYEEAGAPSGRRRKGRKENRGTP